MQIFGQSQGGTKLWAGAVNGSGLEENEETGSFDSNSFKDVYARVGQEIGEHVVGAFVYYGRTRGARMAESSSDEEDVSVFDDEFVRAGADGFVNLGKVIVYGMALYARDADPLGTGESRSYVGGFAQGDVYLNDRTVALLRIDAVHQALPAVFAATESAVEADENPLFRINTVAVTPGLQFLARPNVKLGFEYQIRQTRQEDRALAELHLSF